MLKDFRVLAVIGLLAVVVQAHAVHTAKPITLGSFGGANGSTPEAALVEATDGNFYGTTFAGGISDTGTVFRMSPSGTLTVLHSFNGTDGAHPTASLIEGSDSNFYGTTFSGGSNDLGTVFQISPAGTLITLHQFAGVDGAHPLAEVVEGVDGNFYGTTYSGGLSDTGTVFQITPSGTLTVLQHFNGTNGALPQAGLFQGSDSNLYGTASDGGTKKDGTVFQITPAGTLTVLFNFDGGTNGASPGATLVQARDGLFYGSSAGESKKDGSIFRISSAGAFTPLLNINQSEGRPPISNLIRGNDGNLYGTARGGANGFGTVFRVQPDGTFFNLYKFEGSGDGGFPYSGVILGSDGYLYGTTAFGGTNLHGVVYKLKTFPVGTYSGLALQTNAPSHASSGFLSLVLDDTGSFSAKLTMGGARSTFHGKFDASGNTTNTVPRGKGSALQTIFHLSENGGTNSIVGTVSDGVFTSELLADLAGSFSKKTNSCPWKGDYTFVLAPADRNDVSVPQGYGYATLSVSKNGKGTLKGVLADGTAIKSTVPVSAIGTWPLYEALYGKRGSCLGFMLLSTNAAIVTPLDWFKPAGTGGHFYPAGFTTSLSSTGSLYVSPTAGGPSIATNALVTLGGGNLTGNIVKNVVIDAAGNVTVSPTGADNLTLLITPKTGQITGSFLNPQINKTVPLNGLLLQINNSGAGFFLGTDQSGFVVLDPTP
jgi:uncharacterized repeat protein (TIGR03803 family)